MNSHNNGHTTATVGELCELVNGRAFKPTEWGSEGLPIIRIQNLNDESKEFNYFNGNYSPKHEVNDGDLLFSWSGTPGTSFGAFFWNRGRGVLNQHIFNVHIDRARVDKRYFRYALNDRLNVIIHHAHGGVGLQHITKGKLEAVEILLPPLPKQKRIADILDKADAIRCKRQKIEETSRTLFKATFYRSFGRDFLTRRDCVPLDSLIDQDRGISYGVVQRGTHNPDGIPVARISNIVRNAFDDSDYVRVDPEISDQYKRSVLNGGEVLVSIRGTVGRAAIAPARASGWNVTREVAVIPLLPEIPRHFIHQLILTDEAQRFISGNVKGVAQKGINLRDLRLLPVPSPDSNDVDEFVGQIDKIEELVGKTTDCVTQSANLFNSLVQRAFKGEL